MKMSGLKRRTSPDRRTDSASSKRKRLLDDDLPAGEREEEVVPPLRSSQNLWAAATVGKDQAISPTHKDKQFAEGINFYFKLTFPTIHRMSFNRVYFLHLLSFFPIFFLFSHFCSPSPYLFPSFCRGHATYKSPCWSVGWSVDPSVCRSVTLCFFLHFWAF